MTAAPPPAASVPARSSFVTVVAWIFIVFSGFTTFVSALQNLMVRSMTLNPIQAVRTDSLATSHMPAMGRVLIAHVPLIFLAFLVLSVLTLISSVGLLHRRNWARITFIAMLMVGIVYMLGGLFVQQELTSSMSRSFHAFPVQDSAVRASTQQIDSIFQTMRVVMAVFSLGVAAVFAWIVARLISPVIRAEFTSHAA